MLINKDFFENKENDLIIYKNEVDKYKEQILELLNVKGLSVADFIKFEESFSEKADPIFFKYNFKSLAYQTEENMNVYNEIVKYNKEKLSDLSYNIDYYNFIKNLKVEDEQDQIYKDKKLKSFEDRGLNLPEEKQNRLIEISKELSELSLKFLKNIADARNEWCLEITPSIFEDLNPKEQTLFRDLKMDYNLNKINDLLVSCDNEALREMLYEKNKEIVNKNTKYDNSQIISRIVSLKQENAIILGKGNVANLVLSDNMAENIDNALGFLHDFGKGLLPFAIKENEELNNFVEQKYNIKEINKYSLSYFANKMKEELFSYKKDEECKYLKVENAVNATFDLIENMFGIKFVEVKEGLNLPDEDIKTYRAYNNGVDKGLVVFDLFERKMKKNGAWVYNYLAPTSIETGFITLTANFDKSKEGLTFTDLTTLLHECGHLVHALSSETKYRAYSGTNDVPRDAVEIPSQMLEKFAEEEFFLASVSKGEIPNDLVKKSKNISNYRVANFYTRQTGMALFDLKVYQGTNQDLVSLYKQCMDDNNPTPVDADSNFPMIFAHIFSGGYSAGYYGYLWSDVYSVDTFSFIKENRVELGEKYKKEVLSQGGGIPSKELYIKFRGQEAELQNFFEFYDLKEKPTLKRKPKM